MNTRTPSPPSVSSRSCDEIALALEVVEELADALELRGVAGTLEQVGAPAHDQPVAAAVAVRRPRSAVPASINARESSSSSARRRAISAMTTLRISPSVRPCRMALRKFAAVAHRRGRQARRRREKAVLDLAVGRSPARPAPGRRRATTNSIWRIGASVFGASTRLAPWVRPESMLAGAVEDRVDVALVAAERALDLGALAARDVADLEDAVDEEPEPELRRDAACRDMRGCRAGRGCSRSCIDVADRRRRDPFGRAARASVREPTGSPVSR